MMRGSVVDSVNAVGLRHLFRPMYATARAPVQTSMWTCFHLVLFRDGPPPWRHWKRLVIEKRQVRLRSIPHLAKNERDAPNFLHAVLDKATCAPFFKERRMRFIGAAEVHRKSGMWGTQ